MDRTYSSSAQTRSWIAWDIFCEAHRTTAWSGLAITVSLFVVTWASRSSAMLDAELIHRIGKMPFPLDNRGELSWPSDEHAAQRHRDSFLRAIVEQLKKEKASSISVAGNRVTFKGGLFRFVSGWNILVSVSSGYIDAVPSSGGLLIKYYLSFKQLLIVASVMVFLFLGSSLVAEKSLPLGGKVSILAIAWIWLFGMNYLITVLRFPGFIRRALESGVVSSTGRI